MRQGLVQPPFRVHTLAITVYGGGPHAAILAVVAYLAVLSGSGVMGWRFRTGAWRHIQLTE